MPVGIPKVPYLVPGDDESSWIDVYNRLHQERVIFLGQEINSEISNQLAGLMIYLSIEDQTRDIFMFINSPGGGMVPGMALYDTMQFVKAEVQTVCVGVAASMASLLLLGGAIPNRLAFPHARIMIHQPASNLAEGKSGECNLDVDQVIIMRETITEIFAQRTGKPFWRVSYDMERDSFMSAEEAKEYGIIDIIAKG